MPPHILPGVGVAVALLHMPQEVEVEVEVGLHLQIHLVVEFFSNPPTREGSRIVLSPSAESAGGILSSPSRGGNGIGASTWHSGKAGRGLPSVGSGAKFPAVSLGGGGGGSGILASVVRGGVDKSSLK